MEPSSGFRRFLNSSFDLYNTSVPLGRFRGTFTPYHLNMHKILFIFKSKILRDHFITLNCFNFQGKSPQRILWYLHVAWSTSPRLIDCQGRLQKTACYLKYKLYSPSSSICPKCLTCLNLVQYPQSILFVSFWLIVTPSLRGIIGLLIPIVLPP